MPNTVYRLIPRSTFRQVAASTIITTARLTMAGQSHMDKPPVFEAIGQG